MIGLPGDRLHRERGAAARVAVELREDHAVEGDPLLERLRDVRRPPGRSSRRARAGRSCGFASSRTRASSSISSSSIWRRPAVSTITVSRPSARARSRPLRVASTGSLRVGAVDGDLRSARRAARAGRSRPGAAGRRRRGPACGPRLRRCERELGGGRRLARALEAGEQDHRELAEREPGRAGAHQLGQLVVDDLHDLLAGREALQHLLAERPLAHAGDEVADDREVDVGLEQREADLAHRARDRLLVELAPSCGGRRARSGAVGEAVEHDRAW